MATDFPSTQAWTRLPDIFKSISTAGTPPKFTNEFLKNTLGFASSNDRSIIAILRKLAFITASGEPTQRYNDFKGHEGGRAIAAGLREGWADLFMADQEIHKRQVNDIQKRVSSLTGATEVVTYRVANTFAKLCEIADWSGAAASDENPAPEGSKEPKVVSQDQGAEINGNRAPAGANGGIQLHHDIHLHLPATSDPAVYRAIFQAIKSELV